MNEEPRKLNPWVFVWRALRLRCVECGKSPMFKSWRTTRSLYDWLNPLDGCPHCGYAYRREPGYFMMSICALNYGLVCAPAIAAAYIVESIWSPPMWVHVAFIFAPMPFLSFLLARHAKSLFIAFDHYCDPHVKSDSPVHSHWMTFASPLWLLALIPFAAVALWLLLGRDPRVAVPFVELWKDTDAPKRRASFAIQRPPIALACALFAILLALIAAAGPTRMRGKSPLRVIVDRGVTMPASAADSILKQLNASDAIEVSKDLPAAVKSEAELGPIVVISPQELGVIANDPRVIQIAPEIPANVGIVRVAVREAPKPAVMLMLRNQSDMSSARVIVSGAPDQAIALPARGELRDYFFDLERVGDTVAVELIVDDGLKIDNRASFVRQNAPPAIEVRTTISPELARMIEVYARHRKNSDASSRFAVVDDESRLAAGESGVIVASGAERSDDAIRVSDHPVVANVKDWNSILAGAQIARPPRTDGWVPILQSGERTLVATRDAPARRVWIGFQSDAFAHTTDFVIFWTNVFDWLGGGGGASEFRSDPSNVLDVKLREKPSSPDEWQPKLAAIRNLGDLPIRVDFTRPLIVAALVLFALAASFWQRNRLPVARNGVA